jgi:hypothetical protein
VVAARRQAAHLAAGADGLGAKVLRDIQRSSDYVLAVVLFAASLFFAGMSTKLRPRVLRVARLSIGVAIFVGAVAWLATQPTSVSV